MSERAVGLCVCVCRWRCAEVCGERAAGAVRSVVLPPVWCRCRWRRSGFIHVHLQRVGGSELNGEELLLKQWVLERLRCLDRVPFPELWCCVGVQRIYRHSGFGSCVLCPLRRSEGVFFSFLSFTCCDEGQCPRFSACIQGQKKRKMPM